MPELGVRLRIRSGAIPLQPHSLKREINPIVHIQNQGRGKRRMPIMPIHRGAGGSRQIGRSRTRHWNGTFALGFVVSVFHVSREGLFP
jgi:hypothetical protein